MTKVNWNELAPWAIFRYENQKDGSVEEWNQLENFILSFPGWETALYRACLLIQAATEYRGYDLANIFLEQVKEKYGTLRLYISVGRPKNADDMTEEEYDEWMKYCDLIYDITLDAENITEFTCMECGGPGKIRTDGWVTVYCDDCMEKVNEARENFYKKLEKENG